jgi:hypothetical protein
MYGQELESNLKNLSERLVLGTYRAKPVKRVYIPKADGRQRPIGIPVLDSVSSGTGAECYTGAQCRLRNRFPRLLVRIMHARTGLRVAAGGQPPAATQTPVLPELATPIAKSRF